MAALTVQNSSYVEVGFPNTPISLTCKDNNGNTIQRMTVEASTGGGNIVINLPYIPSLQDNLVSEIVIVIADDSNDVTINPFTPTLTQPLVSTIGSAGTFVIAAIGGKGQSIILRPVSETVWAFSYTV